ncbi:MAG: GspE/PulE family protein, partial [bacterium]
SDIHIEPFEKQVRIRYRIDGILREMTPLPVKLKAAVVSRIKIMARLDISERRLPQDGRIKIQTQGRAIDLRVSVLPCIWGEKVVMRILDPKALMLDITKLGFPERALKEFHKAITMPYGMVLVTGPTGSGKTTTLYSALQVLNTPYVNIMTAEDPVEFNIDGINQVQVHPEIGLTFASALRAFLRQDPNIILVGEIRDLETADIAIKAALTGHLVFSTLHTNDTASSITRLLDLGIEPFLISSTVVGIVAQRLVRKICPHCKKEIELNEDDLKMLGIPVKDREKHYQVWTGEGCLECRHTGYLGRTGIFEVMEMTDKIKKLTNLRAPGTEIKKSAIDEGMMTLREIAIKKLGLGITTLEEVLRITAEE